MSKNLRNGLLISGLVLSAFSGAFAVEPAAQPAGAAPQAAQQEGWYDWAQRHYGAAQTRSNAMFQEAAFQGAVSGAYNKLPEFLKSDNNFDATLKLGGAGILLYFVMKEMVKNRENFGTIVGGLFGTILDAVGQTGELTVNGVDVAAAARRSKADAALKMRAFLSRFAAQAAPVAPAAPIIPGAAPRV